MRSLRQLLLTFFQLQCPVEIFKKGLHLLHIFSIDSISGYFSSAHLPCPRNYDSISFLTWTIGFAGLKIHDFIFFIRFMNSKCLPGLCLLKNAYSIVHVLHLIHASLVIRRLLPPVHDLNRLHFKNATGLQISQFTGGKNKHGM